MNQKTLLASIVLSFAIGGAQAAQFLSLEQAVMLAVTNDPWLHGNQLKQQAVEHRSVAAGSLPDPKVAISMMNLPTDTLNTDQEAMTQLSLGVSQTFARGDSLAIKASQLQIQATQFPLLRADRKAKVAANVSQLWLDAYLAQQTIALIEADWALFEQMAEVAKASYANAIGKTRQQDVIRAQLEIIQLEDRLASQKQALETSLARLNEWLHVYDINGAPQTFNFESQAERLTLAKELPALRLRKPKLLKANQHSRNTLAQALTTHPAIGIIDIKYQVAQKDIALAEQAYKPQWGVNASYGYRDNMPSGEQRADLLSIGVSFDLPLFTENRQDKQVAASIAESSAIKTEKLLLMKQMISAIEKELNQLNRLRERQSLYQQQLLTQIHEQAEASLTAYTNDSGDFSEVVRARIAELNARIAALKIDIDVLKTVARINYFFADSNSPAFVGTNQLPRVEKTGE